MPQIQLSIMSSPVRDPRLFLTYVYNMKYLKHELPSCPTGDGKRPLQKLLVAESYLLVDHYTPVLISCNHGYLSCCMCESDGLPDLK